MKMRVAFLALLTILCLALSVPAFADLYNNGPTLGTNSAFLIGDYPNRVTDSFVANCTGCSYLLMTSFTFAEWVPAGAKPLTVAWAVGLDPFDNVLGSEGDPVSSSTLLCRAGTSFNGGICGGGLGYDVYESTVVTFPGIGIRLGSGFTAWLTLLGATDSSGGQDGWDINFGPSLAYQDPIHPVSSESFIINGAPIPEPSSIMLFSSGMLGLAGILRRKLTR